jgi:hypothetical protein
MSILKDVMPLRKYHLISFTPMWQTPYHVDMAGSRTTTNCSEGKQITVPMISVPVNSIFFHNLYSSPNTIRVMNSKRIGWAEHIERMVV